MKKPLLLGIVGLLALAGAIVGIVLLNGERSIDEEPDESSSVNEEDIGLVIPGTWADPDIIKLADGTYRLYLGEEPETAGNSLDIFSATSADGKTWTVNETPVIRGGTFPDAVQLIDGKIRITYQSAGTLVSALSQDGVNFTKEGGARITSELPTEAENVRAPTTIRLPDGTFRLVYVGVQAGPGSSTAINPEITTFLSATSDNGTAYTGKTAFLAGSGLPFDGFLDGPDLFFDTTGKLHLRFWTSAGRANVDDAGQYEMISDDEGETWTKPVKFYPSADPKNPKGILGGDPTYLVEGTQLFMYYTIRGEGAYLKIFDSGW